MTYALDTNCILRWLIWDVPAQAQKVETLLKLSSSRVHVSDLAIVETVWVLKSVYGYDDDLVIGLVQKVVEHSNINCNRVLFENVLEDFTKPPKVSFVDLCLAHYAGLAESRLFTFDKTLAKKLPKIVELAA